MELIWGGKTGRWSALLVAAGVFTIAMVLFHGRAAATTLTSPTGTVTKSTIGAESEGHITIDLVSGLPKIQCTSTLSAALESQGEGKDAVGSLTTLWFPTCTNGWHMTAFLGGKLNFQWTSGYDGTVVWTGGTFEATRLGVICRYKTENTLLGTITGGWPATIDIEAKLPFDGGSPFCGEQAYSLTGSFKLSGPSPLYVDSA